MPIVPPGDSRVAQARMLRELRYRCVALEQAELLARPPMLIFEHGAFLIQLQWFHASSLVVQKEADSRLLLLKASRELKHMAAQQQLSRTELSIRRTLTELERFERYQLFVSFRKPWLQLQYVEQRRQMYIERILIPPLIPIGNTWLDEHRQYGETLLETEEHQERYVLTLGLRVSIRETILAQAQGTISRAETRSRNRIAEEFDDEWRALYRAFLVEDCVHVFDRQVAAQRDLFEEETQARAEFYAKEDQEVWEQCFFNQAQRTDAHGVVEWLAGRWQEHGNGAFQEYVANATTSWVEWQLAKLVHQESHDRLFLHVAEGNAYHRELDVLEAAYLDYRRDLATRALQKWFRRMLSLRCLRRLKTRRDDEEEHRIEEETAGYERQREMYKADRVIQVLQPWLEARRSCREMRQRQAALFREAIHGICEGYRLRKDMHFLWLEENELRKEQQLLFALLIQRIGRAALVREEVFDISLEKAEVSAAEKERRNSAALTIQWMYRQWKARKTKRENEAAQLLHRIRTRAAIKIQSVARRMFCRQFFTLILVPRHRYKQLLFLQRVLRGAQLRRRLRHHQLALVTQRFLLAYVSRKQREAQRLFPFARRIQCCARQMKARAAHRRLLTQRTMREEARIRSSQAVLIQAAYRGHVVRKKAADERRLAMQVQFTIAEMDAADLDDDLWRIGRGWLARRQMWALKSQRLRTIQQIQDCLRGRQAELLRRTREEEVVDAVCQAIASKKCSRLQAVLRAAQSVMAVEAKRVERRQTEANATVLQRLLLRLRKGYLLRNTLRSKFLERIATAMILQKVGRGLRCRLVLRQQLTDHQASLLEQRRQRSAATIQKMVRQHNQRRHIAAVIIQRSFVLKYWSKLCKRRELTREWRVLAELRRRALERKESIARDERIAEEQQFRRMVTHAFDKNPLWQQAVEHSERLRPRATLPQKLTDRLEYKRLCVEEDAAIAFTAIRLQMQNEEQLARQKELKRTLSEQADRLVRTEGILRQRLLGTQRDVRRSIHLARFQHLQRSIFVPQQTSLCRAEQQDRDAYIAQWMSYVSAPKGFLYRTYLDLQEALVNEVRVAAAPPPPPPVPVIDPVEERFAAAQETHNHVRRLLALRNGVAFSAPRNLHDPTDLDDKDFETIFGAVLQREKSSSSSSSLLLRSPRPVAASATLRKAPQLAKVEQRPLSSSSRYERPQNDSAADSSRMAVHKHIRLPPLEVLQPAPTTAPPVVSTLRDERLLQEHAKDVIQITAEGYVDATDLAEDLTDLTVRVVEEFALKHSARGLLLPRNRLTSDGALRLLRAVFAAKCPLEVIDLSHNPAIDDMVITHLIDRMGRLSQLREVRIVGTSVTPGKRLLLSHMLETAAVNTHKKLSPCGSELGGVSKAAPMRNPRPLQLPRRSGAWPASVRPIAAPELADEKKAQVAARVLLEDSKFIP